MHFRSLLFHANLGLEMGVCYVYTFIFIFVDRDREWDWWWLVGCYYRCFVMDMVYMVYSLMSW